MGISVMWRDPREEVLIYALDGAYDHQQLAEAQREARAMLVSNPRPVSILVDASRLNTHSLLPSVNPRSTSRGEIPVQVIVVVSPERLAPSVMGVFADLYDRPKHGIYYAESEKEAELVLFGAKHSLVL